MFLMVWFSHFADYCCRCSHGYDDVCIQALLCYSALGSTMLLKDSFSYNVCDFWYNLTMIETSSVRAWPWCLPALVILVTQRMVDGIAAPSMSVHGIENAANQNRRRRHPCLIDNKIGNA